jgi:hypothetical protein
VRIHHTKLNWLTQLFACRTEARSSLQVKTVSMGFRAVFHGRRRHRPPGREPKSQTHQQTRGAAPSQPKDARFCGRPAPAGKRRLRECRGGLYYNCCVMYNTFRCTRKSREPAQLSARGEGIVTNQRPTGARERSSILSVNPTSKLPKHPQHIDISN